MEQKEEKIEKEKKDEEIEEIIEEITEENKAVENDEEPSDKAASKGLRIAGIASICVAVLGFFAMGALVYFLAIKPPYIKEKSDREFDILYVTTKTDAVSASDVVELSTPSDVDFDSIKDTAAEIDENAKDYSQRE